MDQVTPVFVCGMGRSGTTNALRVLNTHPSVALNGEIPLSVMKQLFAFIEGVDRAYAKDRRGEGWSERKREYLFDSLGPLSKSGPSQANKFNTAKFRGHKSPKLEGLFEKYELHFGSIGSLPRYFYCARNPFDCWRSYTEVTWANYADVGEFLEDYVASFARLRQMQEIAADRVAILNLDALKAAPDKLRYYRENIFSPLGLDMPESTISRIEKRDESSKPASAGEWNKADRSSIANYPGVAQILAAHFPNAI